MPKLERAAEPHFIRSNFAASIDEAYSRTRGAILLAEAKKPIEYFMYCMCFYSSSVPAVFGYLAVLHHALYRVYIAH